MLDRDFAAYEVGVSFPVLTYDMKKLGALRLDGYLVGLYSYLSENRLGSFLRLDSFACMLIIIFLQNMVLFLRMPMVNLVLLTFGRLPVSSVFLTWL